MLILLAIFAFLLLAGSLFPWNFQAGPGLAQAAWNVVMGWDEALQMASVHDVLLNLAIYVPIGFTAYLWRGWQSRLARWILPVLGGLCLSFSIETLQHYFPPRAPDLLDVICNTLSTLIGIILASVFQSVLESRHIEWRRRYSLHLSSALLLLAIWISELGWPVHAFPLGIGTRIRALLRPGPWAPLDSLEGLLPWFLVGCLLTAVTGPRASRWWLLVLLPNLFLLRMISPGHDFTWGQLGGALAATIFFWLLPERHRYAGPCLAAAWLLWILLGGLRPFTFLTASHGFGWVPFLDMLTGNWMHSIGVLLRKTWVYGAAFWLLAHTRLTHRASLSLTLAIIIAIELAQRWLPGRSAGLTDPSIALLAAALLWLVDYRFVRAADPLGETHPPAR